MEVAAGGLGSGAIVRAMAMQSRGSQGYGFVEGGCAKGGTDDRNGDCCVRY